MPVWGLLANPGFEDKRLKALYFFTGNWKFGKNDPFWSDPAYGEPSPRNDHTYTVQPVDDRHRFWSEDRANRVFAVDEMLSSGANVAVMSSWGARGSNHWAWSAPMQTSPQSHDELFDAAAGRPLLVIPAIESAGGAPGGSAAWVFSDDFPGVAGNPAPGLIEQLLDLIDRYLLRPRDPRWPTQWAQMYDSSGTPRFAVYIIHAASRHLADDDDAAFAAGFDAVANRVLQLTGVAIGFTLDLLPSPHTFQIGDARGWVPWFNPHDSTRAPPGAQISQSWANRDHLDLYVVNEQGAVVSLWWDQAEPGGYRPQGWFPVHGDRLFPRGAPVTAIRRTADHIDLFATDKDGVVRSIWWDKADPAGYRPEGWLLIDPRLRAPAGAPVTASWANEDHLDLFVTDASGIVHSIWWDAEDGYRAEGWFPIGLETRFAPGAAVTARHLGEDHLDLFAADIDGVVQSIWWDSGGGWRAEGWFPIAADARTAPGAPVTALWADDKHLDLFMTDSDGVVRSIYWDAREPLGFRPAGWFSIDPKVRSLPGAPVEALWSHDGGKLHLFIADTAGEVREAVWPDDRDPARPWHDWAAIWPQNRTAPGGSITASHPRGVHIDAFMVSAEDLPLTAWQDDLRDSYVASPEAAGSFLRQQQSVLAVQGYIPEIWLGGRSNRDRMRKKADYWLGWAMEGIPVIMDISPGYDAHIVFPGSSHYGYTDEWRAWFEFLWQPWFHGIVYNAWNGYTEGYAGMEQQISGDRDFAWLKRMFSRL